MTIAANAYGLNENVVRKVSTLGVAASGTNAGGHAIIRPKAVGAQITPSSTAYP